MKRYSVFFGLAIAGIATALWFGAAILAQGPGGQSGSDGNPVGTPQVVIPDQYRPGFAAAASAAETGVATVYFTPQDENSSTTVLFLYNTSAVTGTVGLQTYQLDGTIYIDTSIAVPPAGLVRISGDTVDGSDSATWQDVVLINFRTYSTYARMTLPAGVKATGYVAWNGGSTYDPNQAVPVLPLRFSTDPATVFLPTIQKDQ